MQVPTKQWKDERRTRTLLRAAFGGIAALLLASQITAFFQWRTAQTTVTAIQGNAAESIRLIGRMGFDVQQERILLDRHIFENEAARMAEIQAQIDTIRADYAAAAREYAPLAMFENEAPAWFSLTGDVATAEQQTTAALDLSRTNRDVEAMEVLIAAEPVFDAVSRGVKALIAINQAAADRSRSHAATRVLEVNLGLAAAVLLITLVVGRRLTRVISQKERQLGQQTIELQNMNRELDAFAGRVAHDLRGPLHTISLATSLLAERAPDAAATTAILQRGLAQVTSLVTNLLELSRAGAPMTDGPARAGSVAASVAADLDRLVRNAGGSLEVDVAPASVACSEGLLRQALWNLGENALKYRRPDVPPVIALAGRTTRTGYELRVSDNGLGISPDDARHAFEPFFRSKRTHAIPGTGLGLAIVRRVVEACGGTVSIDSQLDRGTTFVLRLPLAPPLVGGSDQTIRSDAS
ncbi:MAG TPA: ATP-binding protein [Kofleriaceae bacterium]